MATFVVLITETQRGEEQIRDTLARAARFRETAKEFGITVREQFWTMGAYDGVIVFDAPDDETASALLLNLASRGSVRTQTLRAYDAAATEAIIKRSGA
jgi:uncharacterized protein with GYD domain